MDGMSAREQDLRQQLHQLDRELEGSALTPGEKQKNEDQRQAILDELRGMGVDGGAPPSTAA